jgi:hypothetical protein
MSPRRDVSPDQRALKALFRALVDCCGGFDAAAACTRVKSSQLHNYTDMRSDQFAPVDVVADLERVAGEPLVTAELARRAGWLLMPLPAEGEGRLSQSIAHLARETGEACASFVEAMGNDGRIDPAEGERIERELADVARVVGQALAALKQARA